MPKLSQMSVPAKPKGFLLQNLAASSLTGIVVSSLSHPIDTLKCRWQVAGKTCKAPHVFGFARWVLMEEGIFTGLWRPGFLPNVTSMACCIGMRNGLYSCFRDRIGRFENLMMGNHDKVGPAGMFLAGLCSGASGYIIASPLLQVKTQMQAEAGKVGPDGLYVSGVLRGHPPTYQSTCEALSALIASSSGPVSALKTLWRGAGVIVARGSALSASQLMAYDEAKTKLKGSGVSDGPFLHLTSSMIAALVGTTCHMPFDVVLTVYQSAHSLGGERLDRYGRRGPLGCAFALIQESGPSVLLRGWVPAFVRLVPVSIFSFALYEQLRQLFGIGYLD